MATLNLDTNELQNNLDSKRITIVGTSPLTDKHKEILKLYNVIYIPVNFNPNLYGLPSSIKAIRFVRKHVLGIDEYKPQSLDNLHDGLELLEICGIIPESFYNLPSSLKCLIIDCHYDTTIFYNNQCSLDFLPVNLEVLNIRYATLTYENLINLPLGLKELYLDCEIRGTVKNIPNNVKILYINGMQTQINKHMELPEELHTFIFNDSTWHRTNKNTIIWLFENKKIPKGLKKCVLPTHYINEYLLLRQYANEYINTVHCQNLEWKFIDIFNDNLLKHITSIH